MKQLLELYQGETERVGFILASGEIVEVPNISPNPTQGFDVSAAEVLKFIDAPATWHTHPNASSNLSVDDYTAFLNHPEKNHYVVGADGVSCYVVKDGVIHHGAP